jgi:hypothetical protein
MCSLAKVNNREDNVPEYYYRKYILLHIVCLLIGQFWVKHVPASVALCVQFFPSKVGGGLSHFRSRLRVPPPQVTLHVVHESQAPH